MGPSFGPNWRVCSRKLVSCARVSGVVARAASWVMVLGVLTAKRKLSGTEVVQRCQVAGRWGR